MCACIRTTGIPTDIISDASYFALLGAAAGGGRVAQVVLTQFVGTETSLYGVAIHIDQQMRQ